MNREIETKSDVDLSIANLQPPDQSNTMDVGLKSFISEDQIEQKKRIKQEQWEQTRRPDQPLGNLFIFVSGIDFGHVFWSSHFKSPSPFHIFQPKECPEEEYDPRTLYERLKEQRDKKQEEFEESKKFKHSIKTLDNDEVEFLSKVDEHKLNELIAKQNEEKRAIEEFKKQLADQTQAEQEKKQGEFKRSLFSKQSPSGSKQTAGKDAPNQAARTTRRQAALLANAVKRKASEDDGEDQPNKRKREDEDSREDAGNSKKKEDDGDKNDDEDEKNEEDESTDTDGRKAIAVEQPTAFKVLGVLPGMASYYSDSSNSAIDSDDSAEQVNSAEVAPLFMAKQTREIIRMNKTVKKFSKWALHWLDYILLISHRTYSASKWV